MCILDVSDALMQVEMNVFDLAPGRKIFVEEADHIADWGLSIRIQCDIRDQEGPAFFIERTDA